MSVGEHDRQAQIRAELMRGQSYVTPGGLKYWPALDAFNALVARLDETQAELAAMREERDRLREALLMCEDALVDDALDWHEAHVSRGEMDAEDCAVCVVTNALALTAEDAG